MTTALRTHTAMRRGDVVTRLARLDAVVTGDQRYALHLRMPSGNTAVLTRGRLTSAEILDLLATLGVSPQDFDDMR
jgi:hypothetical protein